ncbi:MAG: hypothetical protein II393_04150 [Cytophagales bacterium]|nr:hypothetical protein [Cytophagales bacterium]MBQ5475494.1 hypothetical protein [Lachnospiraceae bacterium]
MRKLSLKQKKLVKEYFDNDLLDYTNVEHRQNKVDLINKLEKFNDYETLWSDVDRLIDDLISNKDLDLKNWS